MEEDLQTVSNIFKGTYLRLMHAKFENDPVKTGNTFGQVYLKLTEGEVELAMQQKTLQPNLGLDDVGFDFSWD